MTTILNLTAQVTGGYPSLVPGHADLVGYVTVKLNNFVIDEFTVDAETALRLRQNTADLALCVADRFAQLFAKLPTDLTGEVVLP